MLRLCTGVYSGSLSLVFVTLDRSVAKICIVIEIPGIAYDEICLLNFFQPIAVAARSKAQTVFARSNTEIMGSNPTRGMDVCVCSVCVYSVSTPCGGGQEYFHRNPCES
jgi:hypothetical protein